MVSKRVDPAIPAWTAKRWLKVKCVQSGYFVVIGYQPDGRGGFANLKLGREENGVLRYAGAVGTGFSAVAVQLLLARLSGFLQKDSPIHGLKVRGAAWTRPELVAEVQYRGFTTTGELRHASIKGLHTAL
jgi:bifunctional non-homologous end joining protein LigD